MTYPYQELEAAGVNIAGLVNENFLNKFSASHHKVNASIYQGADHTDELGDRIEVKFKVANPLQFNLAPIPEKRFRGLYEAHLVRKGMDPANASKLHTVPANVQLTSKDVFFEIAVISIKDGSDIVRVPFNWDMEARCAVLLMESNGTYSIRLDPLKLEFSVGEKEVLSNLRKALVQGGTTPETDLPTYGASDPEWCVKIEKLILLIVNKVIAVQLSNFIRSWELPKAIQLVKGVDFKPSYLNVQADYLAVGGHVTMAPTIISDIQAKATAVLSEFTQRIQSEFDAMSDEQIVNIRTAKLESVDWLRNTTRMLGGEAESSEQLDHARAITFPKNVSLLFDSKPIDYIAKSALTMRQSSSTSTKIDRALKAEAGWWVSITNVSGGIGSSSVWVKATPEVGGYARVCHFDIDPKNFGEWKCYGPGVQLNIKNAKFEAFPSFERDGVYLRGRFSSDGIEVRIPGWPGWANDLLSWVTRALSDPIVDFLGTLLSLLKIRIVEYPKHFPGTGLEWVPNINKKLENIGPYLELSADPTFE